MTRAQRLATIATFFTTIYLLALFSFIPVPFVDQDVSHRILPTLPWWLLIMFGSYSLGSLGWALVTFRDCPEAYEDLMKDIALAKDDLRRRNVTVD